MRPISEAIQLLENLSLKENPEKSDGSISPPSSPRLSASPSLSTKKFSLLVEKNESKINSFSIFGRSESHILIRT